MTELPQQIASSPTDTLLALGLLGYFVKWAFEQFWDGGKKKVGSFETRLGTTETIAVGAAGDVKRNEGAIAELRRMVESNKQAQDKVSNEVMTRDAIEKMVAAVRSDALNAISEAKDDMQAQIIASEGRNTEQFREIKADIKAMTDKMERNKDALLAEIRALGAKRRSNDE